MYRIRFHGRGGQGIKTASQVLGTAFFLEGFEVQDAPRYGAERRGAPIFAYVRAGREPIHERGIIDRPDLVIVADETLIPVPAAGVLQGVSARTVMLINSVNPPEQWQERLKLAGRVLALPVNVGSSEAAAAPLVGASCAGAAARLTGAVARDNVARAVRREIAAYGAAAVTTNLDRALGAYDAMAAHAGLVREGGKIAVQDCQPPSWIDVPLEQAQVSAPDIRVPATSELVNTGAWRTHRPVIDYELCNRCSWVCGTLCPDDAIRVDPDHTPRIDYDHCKGCMVCVAVCPPHAIRAVPETPAPAPQERS